MCKTIKYMILENILNSVSNNMTSLRIIARTRKQNKTKSHYDEALSLT